MHSSHFCTALAILALAAGPCAAVASAAPTPVAPALDEVLSSSRVTFSWSVSTSHELHDAEVHIARKPDTTPSGALLPENEVTSAFPDGDGTTATGTLRPGRYWWQVETYGGRTTPQPFTVQVPLPPAPVDRYPLHGNVVKAVYDRSKKAYGAWISVRTQSQTAAPSTLFAEFATYADVQTGTGMFSTRIGPDEPIDQPIAWSAASTGFWTAPRRWFPVDTYYWHSYELYWWDDDQRYRSFSPVKKFTVRPPALLRLPMRSFCVCSAVSATLRYPELDDADGDQVRTTGWATVDVFRGNRRIHRRKVRVTSAGWTRYAGPQLLRGTYRLKVTTPEWTRSYRITAFEQSSYL